MYRYRLCLIASIILSSCTQPPAELVRHNGPTFKNPDGFTYHSDVNPFIIKVQPGDTLYSIAKDYNTSVKSLISLNRLRPPYPLYTGQRVRIPKANFHVVQKNDNIYFIAHGYNVNVDELIRINSLSAPYTLQAGQRLSLPISNNRPSLDVASNEESDHYAAAPRIRPNANDELVPTPIIKSDAGNPRPITRPTKSKLSRSKPVRFIWPIQGRLLSSFGPKAGGLYNDGINIAAREGANIKAAEAGEIVYAGNELRGYGNLILIKHNSGFLTAYAHAKNILVKQGSYVKKGDVIGKVGKTGNVTSPQLHFSIRKGKKAVNPKKHLS